MSTQKYTVEDVTEAGHDADDAPHILALCEAIDCAPGDLSKESHDHYGLAVYSMGRQEYAIGTDQECDKAARENMEQSVWAFNASFILRVCGLPIELEDGLKAWQEKECDGCNDALLRMINRLAENSFFESAVNADGRGHFLSPYDGDEIEAGEFYAYRVN